MAKLAVFVSGTGSILEAMIAYPLQVGLVIADRECPAADIARRASIPTVDLERTFGTGFDRERYTDAVLAVLREHGVDLVAMAGFMTVLAPGMFKGYPDRILNTHPSLLPEFKGAHAVRDALASGAKITGCTIHVATARLDEGPILAQAEVPVLDGDTERSLHERIKAEERRLYPEVVARLLTALS